MLSTVTEGCCKHVLVCITPTFPRKLLEVTATKRTKRTKRHQSTRYCHALHSRSDRVCIVGSSQSNVVCQSCCCWHMFAFVMSQWFSNFFVRVADVSSVPGVLVPFPEVSPCISTSRSLKHTDHVVWLMTLYLPKNVAVYCHTQVSLSS